MSDTCLNCGHGMDCHGDRAIAACSVPLVGGKYEVGCNCPGWMPSEPPC